MYWVWETFFLFGYNIHSYIHSIAIFGVISFILLGSLAVAHLLLPVLELVFLCLLFT